MVPIYLARRYKVRAEADFWQVVECEHCDLEWAFRVRCGGIGVAESPYFLNNEGASARAQERARRALDEDRSDATRGVARNVACPGCGRFQREMVESLRRQHGSPWGAAGLVGLLVGGAFLLKGVTDTQATAAAVGAVFAIAGGASMAWRRRLQRAFDPNARATSRALPKTSPYRQVHEMTVGEEAPERPDVMTRAQHDALCAALAARGEEPTVRVQWKRT